MATWPNLEPKFENGESTEDKMAVIEVHHAFYERSVPGYAAGFAELCDEIYKESGQWESDCE